MKSKVKEVYLGVSEGKIGTATINNRSETKIIKIIPLCRTTCGASNQHLKNKMLGNNGTGCSLFKHFKTMLVMFAWEVSYFIIFKPRRVTK